jgi:lactoylglutathione lyase
MSRARLVGINHVALEVVDVDAALEFYGRVFAFELQERQRGFAFIDMGDQFLALMEPQAAEAERHFGLVVDDKAATRESLSSSRVETLPGPFLDFRDPFGNRIQVVQYDQIQFTKTERILGRLGVPPRKTEQALAELRAKGLAD